MTEKQAVLDDPTMLDSRALRARLDLDAPLSLGVEEELMLLDAETLDLAAVADEVLTRLAEDDRFKPELPAAQIELLTEPCQTAAQALRSLTAGRRDLALAASGLALPAGAGVHPFARAPAVLSTDPRYAPTRREYGPIAHRQLVFGLHVHVRVSGADRALAVYNALRSHLPSLAALAANAPFYEGQDAGMASVRPKLAELLPRQGVPPAFADLEELAGALTWGLRSNALAVLRSWWWELRLHPLYDTVEVRVADQQTRASESAAIAAVIHCLVAQLADRYDAGERLPVHQTWRIEENRWSACRHGLSGELIDLETGERQPTTEQIGALLDTLPEYAARLDAVEHLAAARRLLTRNGAQRQREATDGGVESVCRRLAADFLAD